MRISARYLDSSDNDEICRSLPYFGPYTAGYWYCHAVPVVGMAAVLCCTQHQKSADGIRLRKGPWCGEHMEKGPYMHVCIGISSLFTHAWRRRR